MFIAIMLIYTVWQSARAVAILSEALLCITHLKVLLCLGKPYKASELASKRWTYFVYDLLSPWVSLTVAFAPYILLAAFSGSACTSMTSYNVTPVKHNAVWGLWMTQDESKCPMTHKDGPGCPAMLYTQSPAPSNMLLAQSQTMAARFPRHYVSALNTHVRWPDVAPAAGPAPEAVKNVLSSVPRLSTIPFMMPAVRTLWNTIGALVLLGGSAEGLSTLLVVMLGHTLLHIYYISVWNSGHGKRVVEMSSCERFKDRLKEYNTLEAAWFILGTSYDIITHAVLLNILLL